MPSSKRISPVNLEWLRNSLPRSKNGDRAYLQPFYDNVLYYPPKESRDKVHSTVMSVLQSDPIADFADTDMTTSEGGAVSYLHALYAIERQRQLYYCDRTLLVSICTILADNWDHMLNKVPSQITPQQRPRLKEIMGQAHSDILVGIKRDQKTLEEHIGPSFWGKTGPWKKDYGGSSYSSASKAYWLLDCIDEVGEFPYELTDLMLAKGGMCNALVVALQQVDQLWKKRSIRKLPCASPRYKLFIRTMYQEPTKTEMVAIDKTSVVVECLTDRDSNVDSYNISLQPAVGTERFASWVQEDWLGVSNIGNRAKQMSVCVAYNLFQTAYTWIKEWGEPDPTPLLLPDLADYRTWSQKIADVNTYFIRHQIPVELTVAQYSRMVKELTGHTPDFKATDDVNPMTGMTATHRKEDQVIPDERPPLEEGEVPGGLEPPDDDDTLRKKLEKTYASRDVTVPQTQEQKEKEESESNGNWMILLLAAVCAVAFMRN